MWHPPLNIRTLQLQGSQKKILPKRAISSRNSNEYKHKHAESLGQQEKKNILAQGTCSKIAPHCTNIIPEPEIDLAKEKSATRRRRDVPELKRLFRQQSENSLQAVWGSSLEAESISPLEEDRCSEELVNLIPIDSDLTTKFPACKKSSKQNKLLKEHGILATKKDKKSEAPCLVDKTAKKQRKESSVLVFAIIDRSNAYGRIDLEHHTVLEKAFNDAVSLKILNSPATNPEIQIINCQFVQGIYKINVASVDCVTILRELVEEMPELWPGAKLRFVSDFPLPVPIKMALYFSPSTATRSSIEILSILGRQNRGLIVDLWEIYNRVQTESGLILEVGIDPSSVAYLQKPKGRVYFLTSKIRFKMAVKSIREDQLLSGKNYIKNNNDGLGELMTSIPINN